MDVQEFTKEQSLSRKLTAELAAGERLLWSGQSDPGACRRASLGILFFAIPWLAFSLFWEAFALTMLIDASGANQSKTPWGVALFMALFGLPFVGIGLEMLAKPFRAARVARSSIHAITTSRVLTLINDARKYELTSRPATSITHVSVREQGKSGHLKIEFGTTRDSEGDRVVVSESWPGIPNAQQAAAAVRKLMETAAVPSSEL
jgi:hypothetical protein